MISGVCESTIEKVELISESKLGLKLMRDTLYQPEPLLTYSLVLELTYAWSPAVNPLIGNSPRESYTWIAASWAISSTAAESNPLGASSRFSSLTSPSSLMMNWESYHSIALFFVWRMSRFRDINNLTSIWTMSIGAWDATFENISFINSTN